MAFGQFEDFAPSPLGPGVYDFIRKDGQKLTMTGPPAEKLAQNIAASKSLAPQPMAQARQQVAPGSRSVRVVSDAAPPPAAPAPPQQALPPAPPPAKDTVPASIARLPQGEGAAPRGQGATGGMESLGGGFYLDESGELWETTSGSARITKEDRERQRDSLTAIPVGKSVTTEGATPQDPTFVRGMNELMDEKILGLDQQKELALKQLANETDVANQVAAARAQQFNDELSRQNEIKARVARDQEISNKARQEYNGATVDPNRMFKGEGGTATAIVAALAAGLGAFGATLGRTENFALNTINGMINRDVAAQEAEIKIKGDAADNALAQLNRGLGDMDQSKMLLRQLQMGWVLSQGEAMTIASKAPEIEARYAALKNEGEMQALQWNEDERKRSLGRAQETVTSQYAGTQAGSRGGLRRVTGERAFNILDKRQNLRKGGADINQTEAQTEKTLADAGAAKNKAAQGPELDAAEKKYELQLATTMDSIQQLVRDYGGQIDPQTGKITGLSFPSDIPGGDTAKTKGLKSRLVKLGTQYANSQNAGAEAGQPTKEALTPELEMFGSGGEEQLQAMATEMTLAKQGWEKSKAQRSGQAPPAGPVQPVDMQKE